MIWPYIRAFVGAGRTKILQVFEMPLHIVRAARLPNRPLWGSTTIAKPPLQFRGMELAHAVIKADFLDHRNPLMPGLGFVLQSHTIIDWQPKELCLAPGGASALSDFVATSLAGRVGQGLSILYAQEYGFAFVGHLRDILRSMEIPVTDARGRDLAVADFVMEHDDGTRCIVEAKGSFRNVKNCPKSTKRALKDALTKQVDPWTKHISPKAKKSFVVRSFLRDHTQPQCDPSNLTFVDPDEENGEGDIEIPILRIKRENYSSWLAAMGLIGAARRLRLGQREGAVATLFLVVEIAGRKIAFPWSSWPCAHSVFDGIVYRGTPVPLIAGIEVTALRAVAQAILGNTGPLAELRRTDTDVASESEDYNYSLFPDGTFLGSAITRRPLRLEEVVL